MKFVKYLITFFYVLIVLILLWLSIIRYGGNFYQIAPGVYRSAQLYYYDMPVFYKKYHFRSILNLRGAHPDKKWYVYEKTFCQEHNITLIDFGISDKEIQSVSKMKKIVQIIKHARKPVLIHCKSGADRTGLASALYLYSLNDKNYSKMLSLKYGHFPYLGSPTKAMDKSFKNYQAINSR